MAEEKNKLLVEIEAQIKELKKGLDDAKTDIDKFADSTEDAAKRTEQASDKTGKLGEKAKKNVSPVKELGDALGEMGGSVGAAGDKISGLSPYISRLGTALSGIAPAGTAAIVAMGAFGAVLGIALIALYKNRDAILEYVAGINDITEAFDAAAKQIGTQIGELTKLRDAYVDSNTSQEDKERIMTQLQKKFPSYFKDLKKEGTNVADVQKAYEAQKDAIIGLGIIKALEAKKAPLYAKIAELSLTKELSLIDKIGLALSGIKGTVPAAGLIGDAILGDGVSDITAEIDKINESIKDIEDTYNVNLADKLGLDDLDDVPGKLDEIQSKITNFSNSFTGEANFVIPEFPDFTAPGQQLTQFGQALEVSSIRGQEFRDVMDELTANAPDWASLTPDPDEIEETTAEIDTALTSLEERMNMFGQDMANLISGSLASTFSDLGAAIGEALATGESVLGAMGDSLLRSFGKFLGDMGNMLIAYGSLAIAKGVLDKVIQSGGPQAIVAGAAAIAVGIALVAISAAMGARAKEGLNGGGGGGGGRRGSVSAGAGGGSYTGGYSGGSSARSTGSGGGTVVFEIAGTKLVGVLSNTLKRNQALGGNLSVG